MKQIFEEDVINTKGSGLYDFTDRIHYFVEKNKLINGILNINILHTSASLVIQENADPDVLHDLNNFLKKLFKSCKTSGSAFSCTIKDALVCKILIFRIPLINLFFFTK